MRKRKPEEAMQLVLNTHFWVHWDSTVSPGSLAPLFPTAEWPSALSVNVPLSGLIICNRGEEEHGGDNRRNSSDMMAPSRPWWSGTNLGLQLHFCNPEKTSSCGQLKLGKTPKPSPLLCVHCLCTCSTLRNKLPSPFTWQPFDLLCSAIPHEDSSLPCHLWTTFGLFEPQAIRHWANLLAIVSFPPTLPRV